MKWDMYPGNEVLIERKKRRTGHVTRQWVTVVSTGPVTAVVSVAHSEGVSTFRCHERYMVALLHRSQVEK